MLQWKPILRKAFAQKYSLFDTKNVGSQYSAYTIGNVWAFQLFINGNCHLENQKPSLPSHSNLILNYIN